MDRSKPMFPDLASDDVFRLETSRLWLRWPRQADAAAFVRHAGCKDIADMTMSIPHPYSQQDAEKFIFSARSGNALGQQVALALTLKTRPGSPPGEAIGMIGLHETRKGHALLGYWLAREYHGLGLMSEAAGALTGFAMRFGCIEQIHASVRKDNAASRRVLEKQGFTSCGSGPVDMPLRGGIVECERFTLDKAAWLASGAGNPPAGGAAYALEPLSRVA